MTASEPLAHPREARFYELDILRGVAAMMVVIYHYKHFFFVSDAYGFDYLHMPLFRALEPIYVYGQFFVELFFSISGYVFFWLYSEAIAARKTTGTDFFIARFSRLYPLYFATFILVALIQWTFHHLYGADFIYHHNGARNFALNLFMVQQWWPHPDMSYNGPSWSISVEVFLYAVFFLLCVFRFNAWYWAALMVAGGLVYKYAHYDPQNDFVRGIPAFFLGGLVWHAATWLRGHETWRKRVALGLVIVVPLLWVLAYVRCALVLWGQAAIPPPSDALSPVLNTETFVYVLVPLSLLMFAVMQGRWKLPLMSAPGLHRFAWIGDVSYSIYLIHYPLQFVLMLGLAHWPYPVRAQLMGSPLTLLAFLSVATGLAWLSFKAFEMPARRILRGVLTRRLAQA